MPPLRQSILIVAHCLTAVFALVCPASAQTLYEGSNATVVEFGDGRQSPRRIAVVGNVERPGVYESTAPRLTAEKLFKACGSRSAAGDYFTRYHSGTVPRPIATWDAESELLVDGDVIVVANFPDRPQPPSADHIHIAVIGLGRDPAVVRIPKSDATVPGLFSVLRQPSDVAASAKVNGAKPGGLLKNGDVVVVSSHLVIRTALIGCDAILKPQSLDAAPEAPNATTEWSPPAALPLETKLPPLNPPSIQEVEPQPADVAASTPAEISVPELPAVNSVEPAEPPPAAIRVAFEEQPRTSRRISDLTPRTESARRIAVESAAVDPDGQIRNLVILIALGTLGVGIALLWVASERRLDGLAAPEPVDLESIPVAGHAPAAVETSAVEQPTTIEQDDLARLIRGELPVQDEPVVLPARVALHGKAVGQKRLVIHPPQGLAGPHFAAPAPAPEKVAAGNETMALPASSEYPPSPARSAQEPEGLLDRVLLAMQREGRR